ncbi:MAG: glutamine--tRNA ligase/YqeY domain fusion protein [Opitutales bacterium]
MAEEDSSTERTSFIREMVKADVAAGKHGGRVQTRFPPEPNGYLTFGHAKAICLNFGLAEEFNGKCNLRFDDTNPEKEDVVFVESMKRDIAWLGFTWDKECYASDYFEQLFTWANQLIDQGDAYVDESSVEDIRRMRGSISEPGQNSPYRDRPVAESRELLARMRNGEVADGAMVLRAKIDMAHPNMNMRDPVMYRIKRMHHFRLGNTWPIYPSYDFTHGQSDSIEGVTHSLCSLEFEAHRPLYDWFIERLGIFPSQQTEFARLNLTYSIMSKRYLRQLVEGGHVGGWDDPRMPTLCGMRRRGIPPRAIRDFMETIGVTKFNAWSDIGLLEHAIRSELNAVALRRMAVLEPLKLVITNLEPDATAEIELPNNPEDEATGTRQVPFSHTLWIERSDFMEDAPKKFFRLKPGGEVRLRGSYVIKCEEVIKDTDGTVTELRCTADLATLGAQPEGRKVKGVIHWVSAAHALPMEVRCYDRLFAVEKPGTTETSFLEELNPDSLQTLQAYGEPVLATAAPGYYIQFERMGYFTPDLESSEQRLIFNRTVTLKDSWAKKA